MILDCKFQILGIKTTVGHYIIIFSRNSSCLTELTLKHMGKTNLRQTGTTRIKTQQSEDHVYNPFKCCHDYECLFQISLSLKLFASDNMASY